MGKYSGVMDGLPKAGPSDPSFQEKVDRVKGDLGAVYTTPAQLAAAYKTTRLQKEEVEQKSAELHLTLTAIEQLLWDRFEAEDIQSLKLEDGSSVSVQVEPVGKVTNADVFREWAIANGYERSMSLPYQTMNALTKARLLDGDAPPDGVEVNVRTKTVFRRK